MSVPVCIHITTHAPPPKNSVNTHFNFGRQGANFVCFHCRTRLEKSKAGCRHFTSEWDSHHFCWSCRDKKKGDYVCVTSKEEDCYKCLQFSSDQKKKLKGKKAYQLKKSKDISKDLEDSLWGPEEPPSMTPASTSVASSVTTYSSDKSTSSDPLLLILERLDSIQGRLSALEKGSTSVSSNEVNMTETPPGTEGSERYRNSSGSVFAVTEEDEDTESIERLDRETARSLCSLSPSSDKTSTSKEEDIDDDPSYRQVLASVGSLLDLPTPEEYTEGPSRIFGSKDRRKKTPILPMSLPPGEEINSRWIELEKKVVGNPLDNGERLLSAPYNNSDTFLPYTRPLMKFYRSTSSDFTTIAPKCQDSFKSVCSKSFTTPPTVSVLTKQFTTMEAVKWEHVQMLGFVSMFISKSNLEMSHQYGGFDSILSWFSG